MSRRQEILKEKDNEKKLALENLKKARSGKSALDQLEVSNFNLFIYHCHTFSLITYSLKKKMCLMLFPMSNILNSSKVDGKRTTSLLMMVEMLNLVPSYM